MGKQYYMAIDYAQTMGEIFRFVDKETEKSNSEIEQIDFIPQDERIGAFIILRKRED